MTRRGFLRWLHRIAWGIWAAVGAYAFGRFLAPRGTREFEERLKKAGKVSEIPVGESRLFYLEGEPVLVIHPRENRFVALSPICTHLRCGVVWDRETGRIRCPCHGATFDAQGNVLSGPPSRPLPRYTVEIKDGVLYIESPKV